MNIQFDLDVSDLYKNDYDVFNKTDDNKYILIKLDSKLKSTDSSNGYNVFKIPLKQDDTKLNVSIKNVTQVNTKHYIQQLDTILSSKDGQTVNISKYVSKDSKQMETHLPISCSIFIYFNHSEFDVCDNSKYQTDKDMNCGNIWQSCCSIANLHDMSTKVENSNVYNIPVTYMDGDKTYIIAHLYCTNVKIDSDIVFYDDLGWIDDSFDLHSKINKEDVVTSKIISLFTMDMDKSEYKLKYQSFQHKNFKFEKDFDKRTFFNVSRTVPGYIYDFNFSNIVNTINCPGSNTFYFDNAFSTSLTKSLLKMTNNGKYVYNLKDVYKMSNEKSNEMFKNLSFKRKLVVLGTMVSSMVNKIQYQSDFYKEIQNRKYGNTKKSYDIYSDVFDTQNGDCEDLSSAMKFIFYSYENNEYYKEIYQRNLNTRVNNAIEFKEDQNVNEYTPYSFYNFNAKQYIYNMIKMYTPVNAITRCFSYKGGFDLFKSTTKSKPIDNLHCTSILFDKQCLISNISQNVNDKDIFKKKYSNLNVKLRDEKMSNLISNFICYELNTFTKCLQWGKDKWIFNNLKENFTSNVFKDDLMSVPLNMEDILKHNCDVYIFNVQQYAKSLLNNTDPNYILSDKGVVIRCYELFDIFIRTFDDVLTKIITINTNKSNNNDSYLKLESIKLTVFMYLHDSIINNTYKQYCKDWITNQANDETQKNQFIRLISPYDSFSISQMNQMFHPILCEGTSSYYPIYHKNKKFIKDIILNDNTLQNEWIDYIKGNGVDSIIEREEYLYEGCNNPFFDSLQIIQTNITHEECNTFKTNYFIHPVAKNQPNTLVFGTNFYDILLDDDHVDASFIDIPNVIKNNLNNVIIRNDFQSTTLNQILQMNSLNSLTPSTHSLILHTEPFTVQSYSNIENVIPFENFINVKMNTLQHLNHSNLSNFNSYYSLIYSLLKSIATIKSKSQNNNSTSYNRRIILECNLEYIYNNMKDATKFMEMLDYMCTFKHYSVEVVIDRKTDVQFFIYFIVQSI